KQPQRYGFDEVKPLPRLEFDEVTIPDATGLDVIARLADTSVATILELNSQFVRGITPPGRGVVVRVPRGRGTVVAERYDSLPVTDRITFVDHYVARGQTLSEIAKRYRVSVAMIEGANPHIRTHALRVGQRIIVPMSGRIVPAGAWSTPPEPRYRRVSRTEASTGSHRVQPFLHLARTAVVSKQRQAQLRLRRALIALQQVAQVAEPEAEVRVSVVQLLHREPGLVQPSGARQHLGVPDSADLALRLRGEV